MTIQKPSGAKATGEETLLNREQAARFLNFSPGTLAVWDCNKRYDLRPIRIGRSVRYRKADLERFLEERFMRAE